MLNINIRKTLFYFGIANFFIIIVLVFFLVYFNFNKNKNNNNYNLNFESVDYSKKMLKYLLDINDIETNYFFNPDYKIDLNKFRDNVSGFNKYLAEEDSKITEKGEKEYVKNLKLCFDEYVNLFDSLVMQNNYQHKIYFTRLLPLQKEVIKHLNSIYMANFYAMMSKNSLLNRYINIIIISLTFCFELILFFILYLFSKSVYKTNPHKEKTGRKREAADYPKYFTSGK